MSSRYREAASAVILLAGLAACTSHTNDPKSLADRITRAVYADDLDATTVDFDDATKRTISRSELGALSDRMHALGDFQSLAQRSAQPDTGKYSYDAHFTRGTLLVELRIDPTGKVGAYRVVPQSAAR